MQYKSLAIIPARSGSERLKDKNIKIMNGLPLIAYTILSASKSRVFDRVIVSTDSVEYAEIAKRYGAKVDFIRPKYLSSSSSKSIDLIRHAVNYYKKININFEVVCLLQPTSPLRTAEHIKKAFALFLKNNSDSVISVTKGRGSKLCLEALYENNSLKYLKSINCNDANNNSYYPNGAIYFFSVKLINYHLDYYSSNTYLFEMDKSESIDIDTQYDFDLARKSQRKLD